MNGLRQLGSSWNVISETRILILSQYQDPQYVLPLLRAGVSGYILKDALGADLCGRTERGERGNISLPRHHPRDGNRDSP